MAKSDLLSSRTQKIGAAGLGLFIFGIIFRTVISPSILESQIKKQTALKKGWPMRKVWSDFPYELRVYLFNVTNPVEIAKGQKPIVEEVGPFVYDVRQEKIDQVDYEESDSLSYLSKDTYFFNAEKSNGLSDHDELTLIHLVCIAIPNKLLKINPNVLSYGVKGIDNIVNNPESIFFKFKVKTFLFDGIRFSCDGKDDFFSTAVCNDIKQFWFTYRMEKGDTYFASSIFGTLNGTDFYNGKIRIRRGIKNIMEVGDIIEYNDMKNMSVWKDDTCDALLGTDGTMFHPFLDTKKNHVLHITKTFYCRSFNYQYDSDVKFKGLHLVRYTATLGTDLETNPKDKCFCIAPDRCLKDGVYELLKCFNLARIGSNPHFYLADPYYGSTVDGVKPMKEKHMSIIDVDPLTGLVVRSHFRIQFSVELTKIKKFRLMKNFPEAMLPMTWIDEVTIMPDDFIPKIKNIYKMAVVMKTLSYLMMIIGVIMYCYSIFRGYKLKKEKRTAVKTAVKTVVKTVESEMKNNEINGN